MTLKNDSLDILQETEPKKLGQFHSVKEPEVYSNDYDVNTIRAYMGRSRMHKYLRTSSWGVPFAAYLLFVLAVLIIF